MKVFLWLLAWLLLATIAHGAQVLKVTFQQLNDCAPVDHWNVLSAPGTSVSPPGVLVGSFLDTATTGVCGQVETPPAMTFVGVGQTTVWMVAVGTDGTVSPPSNPIIVTLPLAAPVLRGVAP